MSSKAEVLGAKLSWAPWFKTVKSFEVLFIQEKDPLLRWPSYGISQGQCTAGGCPAASVLQRQEGPFDLVVIDADKENMF